MKAPMDNEDIIIGAACSALVAGRNGLDQPMTVKRHIRRMEQHGLAVWKRTTHGEGWHLTDKGKALVRQVRAEARRRMK